MASCSFTLGVREASRWTEKRIFSIMHAPICSIQYGSFRSLPAMSHRGTVPQTTRRNSCGFHSTRVLALLVISLRVYKRKAQNASRGHLDYFFFSGRTKTRIQDISVNVRQALKTLRHKHTNLIVEELVVGLVGERLEACSKAPKATDTRKKTGACVCVSPCVSSFLRFAPCFKT